MTPEKKPITLSGRFRKLSVHQRREELRNRLGGEAGDFRMTGESDELVELADALIESAVGYIGVPLGIADGFVIDGERYSIPMATEEPSVVAAASYAARIIAFGGGFKTTPGQQIMSGFVYLIDRDGLRTEIEAIQPELEALLDDRLASMRQRGGGFLRMTIESIDVYLKIRFTIDVCDAMGANTINTAAETLSTRIVEKTGEKAVMSILSNTAEERRYVAGFSLPAGSLPAQHGMTGERICERIVHAYRIASADRERAVTHNKGIMNGITALALATGNDTRGIEAAAHAWASRSGSYLPLSEYRYEHGELHGRLELPIPIAGVGGAVSYHPAARLSLDILGGSSARLLGRVAAALGLAQNFAALLALVSGGIQEGHMRLHERRVAYRDKTSDTARGAPERRE